jgi:hypothetical protein
MRNWLVWLAGGAVICGLLTSVATGLAQQTNSVTNIPQEVAGLPQPLDVNVQSQAQQAALDGLQRFTAVISANPDGKLGFKSVDELRMATAGVPLRIAFIGLQPLATYDATKPVTPMIQPATGLVVPISVAGQVRAGIFLRPNGANFSVVGFGRPHTIAAIMSTVAMVSDAHSAPPQSLTILRIPALYQTFVARTSPTGIMLTSVADVPEFRFQHGAELSAEDALQRLRPAAISYEPSRLGAH